MIKKKPLERHKLLLKRISENVRTGMSFEEAMKQEGYSESYSKSSTHLKETESWDILMKTYLSDGALAKRHQQLLDKEEIISFKNKKGQLEIKKTGQPHADVKNALDMAFKLKGKYEPEEINMKFKGFNKEQLMDLILGKIAKKK